MSQDGALERALREWPAASRADASRADAPDAEVPEPYLRIDRLTKRFGDFTAVDAVSLDVAPGEFVCFLGPSGCGKTTLLRAIAGLELQTAGRVHQGGREISVLPPSARDFGIVFQSYALFPNLTVRRNVGYGLENRGIRRAEIEQRVDELLTLVGLPDQGHKHPAQLSGGQQQRVALARALATSPGLLLLDEPLSALDAKVRVRLRQEIKDLQRRLGVTTIMVTHDQEEALTMADRIVVMNEGRIEQVGTPVTVYREPRTAFVADFIGTMNFMRGEAAGLDKVRVGDLELACAVDGHAGPVTVAIRPEDILVQDTERTTQNLVRVRITRIDFLGSFVRARLEPADRRGEPLHCDFPVDLLRRMELVPGRTFPIVLPSERLRVYPRPAGHGERS